MGRKTTLWIFQMTNKWHLIRENLDMTKKWKPEERNWISSDSSTKEPRKDYVKARIDKMQQNICRLCGDKDKAVNHIISECNKLAQKEYTTRHAWVGKMIHWESCKKFKFDQTNKRYLHNPKSVLENETYKIIWNFEIQMDYLISARRPDLQIINKK